MAAISVGPAVAVGWLPVPSYASLSKTKILRLGGGCCPRVVKAESNMSTLPSVSRRMISRWGRAAASPKATGMWWPIPESNKLASRGHRSAHSSAIRPRDRTTSWSLMKGTRALMQSTLYMVYSRSYRDRACSALLKILDTDFGPHDEGDMVVGGAQRREAAPDSLADILFVSDDEIGYL